MTSPITPSIELVEQWWSEWTKRNDPPCTSHLYVATKAAQWGADQELETCCEWSSWRHSRQIADQLRDARRPKPLSLKEQALTAVAELEGSKGVDTIRRALEALDD